MSLNFVDYIAFVMLAFKGLLFVVALVFLVSGLDELVVDVIYFVRTIYRSLFIWQRFRPITEQELLGIPEQRKSDGSLGRVESRFRRIGLDYAFPSLSLDEANLSLSPSPALPHQTLIRPLSVNKQNGALRL